MDDNDNEIWEKVHKFLSDQIDDFSNSNSGFAVQLNDSKLQKASEKLDEDESELMKQVNEIIDAKIRPFLQEDGGDITILVIFMQSKANIDYIRLFLSHFSFDFNFILRIFFQ